MEGLFYNVNGGYVLAPIFSSRLVHHANFCRYLEGIVRGYRNSLLTSQNYSNLTQCETIDGTIDLSSLPPLYH